MRKIMIISLLFLTSSTYDEDFICSCKEYKSTASEHSTPLIDIYSNLNNAAFSNFIDSLIEDTVFVRLNNLKAKTESLKDVFVSNVSKENQNVSSPIIGYAKAKDTAEVNHIFNKYLQENKHLIESEVRFLWSQKSKDIFGDGTNYYSFFGINYLTNSELTENNVEDVYISKHPNDQYYGVEISFNNEGSADFSNYTKEHTMEFISIISYNKVLSAPMIFKQVTGGQIFIDGQFTKSEAEILINRLDCFNYSRRIGQRKFDRKIKNCK